MDKPTRTKVADYIDKAIEDSKKDGEDEPLANATSSDTNVVQVNFRQSLRLILLCLVYDSAEIQHS